MQNAGDMMDRLNQSGRRLSKSHRRIAEYITANYDKAVFMTAARLGECVGVSESTVVRFASALGYEGYPQLQRSLQELVSHRLTANQRFERVTEIDPRNVLSTVLKSDAQNLHATLEELDPAVFENVVSRILSARSVYVIGLRSAAPLAQFLVNYLRYMFDHVRLVSGGAADGGNAGNARKRRADRDFLPAVFRPDGGGHALRPPLRRPGGGRDRRAHEPPVRGGGRLPHGADGYRLLCGLPCCAHQRDQRAARCPLAAPEGRPERALPPAGGYLEKLPCLPGGGPPWLTSL